MYAVINIWPEFAYGHKNVESSFVIMYSEMTDQSRHCTEQHSFRDTAWKKGKPI